MLYGIDIGLVTRDDAYIPVGIALLLLDGHYTGHGRYAVCDFLEIHIDPPVLKKSEMRNI